MSGVSPMADICADTTPAAVVTDTVLKPLNDSVPGTK